MCAAFFFFTVIHPMLAGTFHDQRESQRIIKVISTAHLGAMNLWTKFHGSPFDSLCDRLTEQHCHAYSPVSYG